MKKKSLCELFSFSYIKPKTTCKGLRLRSVKINYYTLRGVLAGCKTDIIGVGVVILHPNQNNRKRRRKIKRKEKPIPKTGDVETIFFV